MHWRARGRGREPRGRLPPAAAAAGPLPPDAAGRGGRCRGLRAAPPAAARAILRAPGRGRGEASQPWPSAASDRRSAGRLVADHDQALAGSAVRRGGEVAIHSGGLETGPAQADLDLLGAVDAYALEEGARRPPALPNPDALVQAPRRRVVPALDRDFAAIVGEALLRHQPGQRRLGVEKVDQELPLRFEHPHDLLQHPEVLPLSLEIAEGGEEVEDPVERLRGEGKGPHVPSHARDVAIVREQGERQVDAKGAPAAAAQGGGVTPGATAEVEHGGARRRRPEMCFDEINVRLGLLGVAVAVELEVVLAEPLAIPGHATMIRRGRAADSRSGSGSAGGRTPHGGARYPCRNVLSQPVASRPRRAAGRGGRPPAPYRRGGLRLEHLGAGPARPGAGLDGLPAVARLRRPRRARLARHRPGGGRPVVGAPRRAVELRHRAAHRRPAGRPRLEYGPCCATGPSRSIHPWSWPRWPGSPTATSG